MSNIPNFNSIVKTCDGSHDHAKWSVYNTTGGLKFDTALEAAYPDALCSSLAGLIGALAAEKGFTKKSH